MENIPLTYYSSASSHFLPSRYSVSFVSKLLVQHLILADILLACQADSVLARLSKQAKNA